ncbi:uncharacterized protein FOMMEDRAFT_126526 [Fomitiporia mediterranea MF3/22]|uniref:uncharacterized protein n=1 Tax=Fomitiporia mediterranea (strain MF3/22) TaxID=694068 RepID=UPI000440847D|nr:uncharacterized protein FOMMEDRAFT_126526 [Fomitiporia mediterranea MF3/22]EJD01530.1 hypothetical protein FOMMEDRAFT_126526 [Fomitiporia mediterranea MF3/22]
MAGLSDRTPLYLSPRSADVVLSEIRPTKLAPEALRSVNVLLDELLWMILSMARSFATDQLKGALSKLLPTSLGKEALLEAEVELRAYWDRTSNHPSRPYAENSQEFPIQPAFELLRLKCEAFSTFNDSDEDTDSEKRWQAKVTSANGFSSHNAQFIAPSALYLTAILEHVCEHVLSNTGRVASRDSSRSTATLQDLFLALCEDDSIYGLFKVMKVHNQIESQCNALAKPRGGRSSNRSVSDLGKGSSHTNGSPFGSVSTFNGDGAKPRVSSDSAGSGTAVAALQSSGSRSSTEKSKAKKLFGRMSVDKESGSQGSQNSLDGAHKRSGSVMSGGKRPSSALDDGPGSSPSEVEFDELMRSGTTMKVSLTPDRLRTFDVYNKEKGRGVSKILIPAQQVVSKGPLQDSPTINTAAPTPPQKPSIHELGALRNGDGDELNGIHTRKEPKKAPPVSYDQPHSRARSTSASQASIASLTNHHANGRKASLGTLPIESIHSQSLRGTGPLSHPPKSAGLISSNAYSMRKVHQSSSRDSIDEIMDGTSDDDAPVKKPTNRRRAPTVGGVTAQTADLIDFLNSGPPDEPKPLSPSSTAVSSLDKQKRGRLRSIVSRLKGGQSMDKLPSQSSYEDFMSGKKSPAPPPAFVPPPLSAKRSLHSLSSYSQSQTSLQKGRPPPVPSVTIPLSPPQSPSQSVAESNSLSPNRPKPSPTSIRKAVPAFAEAEISKHENGTASLAAPKSADVSPRTPTKVDTEANFLRAQQYFKDTDNAETSTTISSSTTQLAHKSSDTLRTPPPSFPSVRPSSKQSQRHALSPPSTPKAFAVHATDLRRLMANATSADECRLLVDMFLAQSGLPVKDADFPPDPRTLPSAQQEHAVIEALLSHGDAPAEEAETPSGKVSPARDAGGPPTPRSDDQHATPTIHRKAVPVVHASPVISAEA